MASKFLDIEKGLVKLYAQLALPYQYEAPDLPLDDKPENEIWVALHNLRGNSRVASLGDNGENHNPGILQIDINNKKGRGSGDVLAVVDQIIGQLNAGSTITENGQKIRITNASVSPGRYVGGFYRVSISLNYYARTIR